MPVQHVLLSNNQRGTWKISDLCECLSFMYLCSQRRLGFEVAVKSRLRLFSSSEQNIFGGSVAFYIAHSCQLKYPCVLYLPERKCDTLSKSISARLSLSSLDNPSKSTQVAGHADMSCVKAMCQVIVKNIITFAT